MKITKPIVKDNCKDCASNCEHAGRDREFVCIGGVSCKKTKQENESNLIKWLELQIIAHQNSLNSFNQGLCRAYKNVYNKILQIQSGKEETENDRQE